MLNIDLYINSAGIISGAGNNMSGNFLQDTTDYSAFALAAVEPDYKAYIPVMQLRRMSKAVRMGVVASKVAMQQAGMETPDAISVGTAYGCLQDTESFLGKMIEQDEQMLTPTAFIQSTHNTVSGQIALLAGCNGHNLTYVHRGHSFEHALINAKLHMQQHPGSNILIGAIEEQTPNSVKALQYAGAVAKENYTPSDVLGGKLTNPVCGEGAAFFSLTEQPLNQQSLKIAALDIFKATADKAFEKIENFAAQAGPFDLFVSGSNGEKKDYALYQSIAAEIVPGVPVTTFKQLCGEYPVASSFVLGMLWHRIYPGIQGKYKNVLLVNNHCDYYSCWTLELW
ncbi:MAG: beta-ketoacyl synthase chain length factor [Taibaiella sp.]|nr:beta-ketoacyl synthase chain length factor [Taibaiella sp.]